MTLNVAVVVIAPLLVLDLRPVALENLPQLRALAGRVALHVSGHSDLREEPRALGLAEGGDEVRPGHGEQLLAVKPEQFVVNPGKVLCLG